MTETIARQVADFFSEQLAAVKFIKYEADFTLISAIRIIKAAHELGDVTVTFDPGNPEQVKFFAYPTMPVDHKTTVRVQRTNHRLGDSRCYWAEVTHYSA